MRDRKPICVAPCPKRTVCTASKCGKCLQGGQILRRLRCCNPGCRCSCRCRFINMRTRRPQEGEIHHDRQSAAAVQSQANDVHTGSQSPAGKGSTASKPEDLKISTSGGSSPSTSDTSSANPGSDEIECKPDSTAKTQSRRLSPWTKLCLFVLCVDTQTLMQAYNH